MKLSLLKLGPCMAEYSYFVSRFDLIAQCWNTSPKERPSFEKLVLEIDTFLENVAGYIEFSEFCGENQTQ